MEINFIYTVTDDVLHHEFLMDSIGPKKRSITLSLTELSEQARKDLLGLSSFHVSNTTFQSPWDIHGNPRDIITIKIESYFHQNSYDCYTVIGIFDEYDHATITILELESKLTVMLEQFTVNWKECQRLNDEFQTLQAKRKLKSKKNNAKITRVEELRDRQQVEEINNWILQYGSETLLLANTLGYDCQRLYTEERRCVERPDYELDFDGRARWDFADNPSLSSLKEAQELINSGNNAKIVHLTRFPDGTEPETYNEFDPDGEELVYEAIVIKNFLGHYDLIKVQ